MWDNESERIGKRKCTPIGYALHGVSELLGLAGLILLIAAAVFYRSMFLVAVALGVGAVSEALFRWSWAIAFRKGWRYDPERREASWMEGGKLQSYRFEADR